GKGKAVAAVADGHRRAALPRPAGGFPPFVVLTLGDVPLAIRGTVVDATGNAVKDARVWCVDPTLLCESRDPVTVEGLAAGVRAGGRSGPSAFWPFVTTAGDGSFELGGLDDRAYTLRAMEDETLTRADVPSIAAGATGVRIVLPTGERFERLAGTVVTRSGAPVPGVNLTVQSDPHSLRGRTMHARAVARATSGSDGRFFLPKVPHRAVYLRLDGDTILPLEYGRDVAGGLLELAAGSPEDLRLVVAVRVHVQVELLDPASADAIRVLDGDGRALIVNVFEGRGRRETDELELPGGKSPVFVVPDSAATLVLAKAGKEVRREPLQLRPGAVNTLRL
ncbi:MAG: carboxypeptidase-like regulatory domain-containing protein, partial [Planctomycetota bacterium]